MNKLLIILLFPLLTFSQRGILGIKQDKIPFDKQMHFVGGFMINTLSQPIYEQELGMSKWGSIGLSLGTTGLIAVTKEIIDNNKKNRTGFDEKDIAYTMAGSVVSVGLILIIK